MSLKQIFPTRIYQTRFHDVNLVKDICDIELKEIDFNGDTTLLNPQHSQITNAISQTKSYSDRIKHNIHNYGRIKTIAKFIEDESKKYWDSIGYYSDVTPKISMSWCAINNPGGSMVLHSHSPNPIACAFYFNAEPGQGNIVFENPLESLLTCQPIKKCYENFIHECEVRTGDLIIFPGYLKHYVTVNQTDNPRIVMSCNLNERGY